MNLVCVQPLDAGQLLLPTVCGHCHWGAHDTVPRRVSLVAIATGVPKTRCRAESLVAAGLGTLALPKTAGCWQAE